LPTRVIMLVDLDYFFAQCEEKRNSSIKDKPVVVCVYSGRTEESGVVSTANYIARSYGVKSGMPIYQAKKKLENVEAIFLPVDHDYYEEVSGEVMRVVRQFADLFEQVGIDEAFLDVTVRTNGRFQAARELAERIRNELRAQLGLTCSIGVGPNKLVAKVAADQNKPDGLTVIEDEKVEHFFSPLNVERLVGVGTKTREKMHSMGIMTVGDLARCDAQKLMETFGKTLGIYFHNAAQGVDNEPVKERTEIESLSRIVTLKQDSRDTDFMMEKTEQLCTELHAAIVDQKVSFKTIGIIVILNDMSIHSKSRTLENPTNSLQTMKENVRDLFKQFFDETGLEARRVGVKISNLSHERESQKPLTSFIQRNTD